MSDAHIDLIKLFVVSKPGQYVSRDEIAEAIGQQEVTRRLRELRQETWGGYNIRCDLKRGYIYKPDDPSVLSESTKRRRNYLVNQSELFQKRRRST